MRIELAEMQNTNAIAPARTFFICNPPWGICHYHTKICAFVKRSLRFVEKAESKSIEVRLQ